MSTISFIIFFLLLSFANSAVFAESNSSKVIAIIASGETHAMLDACDCPEGPAGGLPKRSQMIKNLGEKSDILLIDAGGYAGGGIYDFYTEGRARDSVRTLAVIHAMASMGYDAVAIGDEELQFGAQWLLKIADNKGLPLVSANCRDKSGKYITEPFRIIKKENLTFGITAVTTTEKLFPIDTSIVIEDPVESLKLIWKKLQKKSDYQIILSHLGEEETQTLAEQFPECDILVNGHRKMSIQPVTPHDKQFIMQFGFQGKNLSVIEYNPVKKSFQPNTQNWIAIEESIPDDSIVRELIKEYMNVSIPEFTVFDLYIMSQCPYGIPALRDLLIFSEQFPSIELSVWFIGDILKDGSLKSLHGREEIEDEKRWLAVKQCYPDMWSHFVYLVAAEGMTTKRALVELELDLETINTWVLKNGDAALTDHYYRSQRQNIDASPSLFINNHMYGPEISYLRLSKDFCADIIQSKRPPVCDSLPECFEDRDCRMKGKIGTCVFSSDDKTGGTCSYKDALVFEFIIVIPDSPVVHTEYNSILTTEDLFPGARIRVLAMSASEGKKIIKNINPDCLPLYLFEKEVKKSANFFKIESGIKEVDKWFTFKDDVMKKHYFLTRKLKSGSMDIYIDPLFPDIGNVLKTVLDIFPNLNGITIKPIIYERTISDQSGAEEKMRHEEALRWLVLAKYYGNKTLADYLNSYRVQPGSSYWFSMLKNMKIDVDKFVRKVKKSSALLKELYTEIMELEIVEPVELLIENREVVLIKNQSHFEELMKRVTQRFNKSK